MAVSPCAVAAWLLLLQAVTYFLRALKLNRNYLSAWTLMGHEYVEMKNIPAAIGKASRGFLQPSHQEHTLLRACCWETRLLLPAHKRIAATVGDALMRLRYPIAPLAGPLLLSAGWLQLSWQLRGPK